MSRANQVSLPHEAVQHSIPRLSGQKKTFFLWKSIHSSNTLHRPQSTPSHELWWWSLGNLFDHLNQGISDGHAWETLLSSVGARSCMTADTCDKRKGPGWTCPTTTPHRIHCFHTTLFRVLCVVCCICVCFVCVVCCVCFVCVCVLCVVSVCISSVCVVWSAVLCCVVLWSVVECCVVCCCCVLYLWKTPEQGTQMDNITSYKHDETM